jgi:hypothetical protein
VTVGLDGSYQTVAQLSLPEGKYFISGSVEVENFASETDDLFATCELDAPFGGNIGSSETAVPREDYEIASLAVQGAENAPIGSTVKLDCRASVGLSLGVPQALKAYGAQISAIKVGDIHEQ